MDQKFSVIIFTAVIVLLVAIVVFSFGNTSKLSNTNVIVSNNSSQTLSLNSSNLISTVELSKHNLENDCWVVYKNEVYDLTSWLPRHPGSAGAILPYCGNLGFEAAFIQQHGNSKASLFMKVAKFMGEFEVKGQINN
jgi:cytochrome b involved in lipid metabolism